MYLERKQDLSLIFFLKDLFSDIDNLSIVDSFPENELTLPTISVETYKINTRMYELGNFERLQSTTWSIDIFALNKSQRDEMGYRILNSLYDKVSVYNYDEGFPPDSSPTRIGVLRPDGINLEIIRVMPELVDVMHYRAVLIYTANYEQIT